MSIADHTTAADGQSLASQPQATQQTLYGQWGVWAPVYFVLSHDHEIGQGDPPPPISPVDAVNARLPIATPCSNNAQCASQNCDASHGYICGAPLTFTRTPDDAFSLMTAGGGVASPTASAPSAASSSIGGLNLSSLTQGKTPLLIGGAIALFFLFGGHHRRGGLL